MDRNTAELLMKELLALEGPLNAATEISDQISDKEEQAKFRRGMAELMLKVYADLMRPIIRQYPDLDPDR